MRRISTLRFASKKCDGYLKSQYKCSVKVILVPAKGGDVLIKSLLVIMLSIGLVNCATIVSSKTAEVRVRTTPSEVRVESEYYSCTTPCKMEVERGETHNFVFKKPGYKVEQKKVGGYSINPWLFGNLISFSWPGLLVDLISGNGFAPSQKTINLAMVEDPHANIAKATRVKKLGPPPSVEEFEKSIVAKPAASEIKKDLTRGIPSSWPQKWFYETETYKYWTVKGERQSDQALAHSDSIEKASKIIESEFPQDRYSRKMPFETTHMEVRRVEGQFESWRIIRVKQYDIATRKM